MEKTYPTYKCGITNVGNTCFINTALQCLSRIRRFAKYFERGGFRSIEDWDDKPEHLKNMCTEWEDLTNALRSSDTANIVPNRFYILFREAAKAESMDWLVEGQNDSHEFMMFFIDTLHKAISKDITNHTDIDFVKYNGKRTSCTLSYDETETSLNATLGEMSKANWSLHFAKEYHHTLTRMFHGQFLTIISSKASRERSFSFDPFSSINIAVPTMKKGGLTIQDCLDKYFSPEILQGGDQWESPTAGKVDASRATRIWMLPDVLILSLKRFTMTGEKINTKIEFPLEKLDMRKYMVGPESGTDAEYDLVGCVLHSGIMFGGHYIAVVRNPGGSWVLCNDSNVRAITPESFYETTKESAYTLVYQKTSILGKDDNLDRNSE